ncbi:MAG: hypothetical protein QM473_09435 [Acidobacteriota bacterium]|nr:hypothetical protein [Acidobacteriota bacterium]
MPGMHHHAEILGAICDLCRGAVRLNADVNGGNVLEVGSNRVLRVGDSVRVEDDQQAGEMQTVAGLSGRTQVVLEGDLSGSYAVDSGARVVLVSEAVPKLAWVGRGKPELAPQPTGVGFPCVVVAPTRLEQPMSGGTNRSYSQEYHSSVYYVRRDHEGEEAETLLLEEVGRLFSLLMRDPYLAGTCWYSQVVGVDYEPHEQAALDERMAGLRVVRLDLVGLRAQEPAADAVG